MHGLLGFWHIFSSCRQHTDSAYNDVLVADVVYKPLPPISPRYWGGGGGARAVYGLGDVTLGSTDYLASARCRPDGTLQPMLRARGLLVIPVVGQTTKPTTPTCARACVFCDAHALCWTVTPCFVVKAALRRNHTNCSPAVDGW